MLSEPHVLTDLNYFVYFQIFSDKQTIRVAVTNSGTSLFRRFVCPFVNAEGRKGLRGIRPVHLPSTCLNCHDRLFAGTALGVNRRRRRCPRHIISTTIYKSQSRRARNAIAKPNREPERVWVLKRNLYAKNIDGR